MRRHVRVPAVRSMGMNSCVCVYNILVSRSHTLIASKRVWLRETNNIYGILYYYIGWLALILNMRACIRSMESETRLGSALGD